MISGRKESIIRHIVNPCIHAGHALAVPYVDYIASFKTGIPVFSSAHLHRSRNKSIRRPLISEESLFDKIWEKIEEKMWK